jgi:hypothetical protein
MNVERSIEHLLELHARAEARMDRADRQIEAIRKLVKTGMKLIVRIEANQARTDAKIDKLAEIWLKRPPNGHSRR